MSVKLPFILGGGNCSRALTALQLLLWSAMTEERGVLKGMRDALLKSEKKNDEDLKKKTREQEASIARVEELLTLIVQAMNGKGRRQARKDLVLKLRAMKTGVGERASELARHYPGRNLILMADSDFFELIAKIVEADS
jgi:hypothetical protein